MTPEELREKRERYIADAIPAEYRKPIDRARLANPGAFDRVQAWSPEGEQPGLVVLGATRRGKTRAVYWRLAQLHRERDLRFCAYSADELKRRLIQAALNGGGNDRGSFAVTVDGKRIATLNTINNNYIVCDVDYSAGAPVVTSFAETPAAGSGRANCAFDAAGNLYTTSANDERLRVFELPTTENKFTTPAPSSQQLTVSAAGVENWEVM